MNKKPKEKRSRIADTAIGMFVATVFGSLGVLYHVSVHSKDGTLAKMRVMAIVAGAFAVLLWAADEWLNYDAVTISGGTRYCAGRWVWQTIVVIAVLVTSFIIHIYAPIIGKGGR